MQHMYMFWNSYSLLKKKKKTTFRSLTRISDYYLLKKLKEVKNLSQLKPYQKKVQTFNWIELLIVVCGLWRILGWCSWWLIWYGHKPVMEAALGFHHCTTMGAKSEFQPKGLIGGVSV